jgi:hypothetical protein
MGGEDLGIPAFAGFVSFISLFCGTDARAQLQDAPVLFLQPE